MWYLGHNIEFINFWKAKLVPTYLQLLKSTHLETNQNHSRWLINENPFDICEGGASYETSPWRQHLIFVRGASYENSPWGNIWYLWGGGVLWDKLLGATFDICEGDILWDKLLVQHLIFVKGGNIIRWTLRGTNLTFLRGGGGFLADEPFSMANLTFVQEVVYRSLFWFIYMGDTKIQKHSINIFLAI